jgi:hypothetical protein
VSSPTPRPWTIKEICFNLEVDRTTVWRWKVEGAPFVRNRILESELVWWLEQRDAARILGLAVRVFLQHPREVREKLLEAAVIQREARVRRKHTAGNNLQHSSAGEPAPSVAK